MVEPTQTATAEKYATRYTQAEVNYTPDYTGEGGHCASCRWFIAHSDYGEGCTIVESYPADILATGRCDRHEPLPTNEPMPMPVVIVDSAEMEKAQTTPPTLPIPEVTKEQSLIALVKATVADMLHKRIEPRSTGFKAYGNHWVGWWTNNAEDRDKEWFPAKAIDDYVDRVDIGVVPQPTLWFWHIPGSRHGKAEWQGRIGHYCVAVGSFDDTPAGKAARDHYNRSKARYSMSHGFAYDKTQYQDGTYHQFNTFELSVLPPQVAANPYTDFEGIKQMELSPEKVQALEKLVGKDIAAQIISETEAKSKALDELNVQFKDFVQPAALESEVKADDDCMQRYMDEGMSKADAKAKCMESKALREDKVLATLVVDMLKDQAGVVTLVDAMGKAIKSQDDATASVIEGLKQDLADIKALLDQRPRIASKDSETVVDESKVNPAVVEQMKELTTDNFYGTTTKVKV